jgi:hypothetical protein
MRSIAPEFDHVHVTRSDTRPAREDASKVALTMGYKFRESFGEESAQAGLGDVDEDMSRILYV